MLNERIVHSKFGSGIIVEVNQNRIKVMFVQDNTSKLFIYPDAFDTFMKFERQELQAAADEALGSKRASEEQLRQQKHISYMQQERERKKARLEALKKKKKSVEAKAEKEKREREKEKNPTEVQI